MWLGEGRIMPRQHQLPVAHAADSTMNSSAAGTLAAAANAASPRLNSGHYAVVGAFLIWGLLPLYLRLLAPVPALQIMAHRVIWCCVFVFLWLGLRGQLRGVGAALANPRSCLSLAASALLISSNWVIYVWAANAGHVLELSLGYFINPLINVLLGVAVLRERLNRAQWTAVAFAALGVVWLTVLAGRLPWIALSLAVSFSLYGLIRKTVAVEAITGLATETLLIAPFAAVYLVWIEASGSGAVGNSSSALVIALLIAGGLVTAVPLSLFSFGARLIPYSTVGLIQYLSPTMLFGLSLLVFHEPFSSARATGFALIWLGLAIYAGDGLLRRPKRLAAASPVAAQPGESAA
jgi:chloramphenicol-sensitive protein RarD